MQPNQKTHGDKPPMQGNPLDKLEKQVEALTSATVEYTSLELELVDKKHVLQLIKDMKEKYE